MIKQLAQTYLLLAARKRLAESSGLEMTPDELAAFFLARGCGGLNFAMAHLQLAMEDIVEWQHVVNEIRWAKFFEEEARREREQADEL